MREFLIGVMAGVAIGTVLVVSVSILAMAWDSWRSDRVHIHK